MLDAAHSSAPSGSAAASSRASHGSLIPLSRSTSAVTAARTAASARCHAASHVPGGVPGPGAPRSRTPGTTADALRPGSAHRPGPWATT